VRKDKQLWQPAKSAMAKARQNVRNAKALEKLAVEYLALLISATTVMVRGRSSAGCAMAKDTFRQS